MSISDIRASVRRYWSLAAIVLLLTPLVMAIYLAGREVVQPPASYTTSADILIPARADNEDPENIPPVLLQGQIDLALAPDTKRAAIENAELSEEDGSAVEFSARLNDPQTVMTLSVEAPAASLAARAIDGYIQAYETGRRDSVREAALELQDVQRRTVAVLDRRLAEVEELLVLHGVGLPEPVADGSPINLPPSTADDDILLAYERNALLNERLRRQVDYSLQSTRVQIPSKFSVVVQRRSTARITPPPPSPLIPLLQIVGVGLLLAIGLPVARDRLDGTITEARGAPGALRSTLLAELPPMSRRLQRSFVTPGSEWDVAFRSLAATCISTDRLPKAIMVTSPASTTQDFVAANFASGLESMGATVALVGTVPRQDWFVRESDGVGVGSVPAPGAPGAVVAADPASFTTLLREAQNGQLGVDLRPRLARRDRSNLFVIPPGGEDEQLSLDGLPPLLEALARSDIDVTVVAGPALLPDPNATIIAWSTRHVLWAVELGQVERSDAHLAADRLELAGVEAFGIALMRRHVLRS